MPISTTLKRTLQGNRTNRGNKCKYRPLKIQTNKALANTNCNPQKKSDPITAIANNSRGLGHLRIKIKARGARTIAPPKLRKKAIVTGSVSVTRNLIATNEEPPIEVDRHAARAANIARRFVLDVDILKFNGIYFYETLFFKKMHKFFISAMTLIEKGGD